MKYDFTADYLVCPVNCAGAMGAGLALEFRRRWPRMYYAYRRVCEARLLAPGGLWVWQSSDTPTILCAATKDHWRGRSDVRWVKSCIDEIYHYVVELPPGRLSVPTLGCGLGGLAYEDVRPLLEKLRTTHHTVTIYPP